jgi:hypothetical protein
MTKVVQTVTVRPREKRRGVRLNSCVPVAIEWESSAGGRCAERAQTRVVGPYGCLVVLSDDLALSQEVQVTNLASERSNRAVVVWRGHQRAEGWELGIALIQPEMDFWGLEL